MRRYVQIVIALMFLVPVLASGQTVPGSASPASEAQPLITTADPKAAAVLNQALAAISGAQGIAQIRDFTATGTITYFWAEEPVQGPATVQGRIPGDFRLDASLPEGTRSYAVLGGAGVLTDGSGTLTNLPLHNTIDMGTVTFPFLTLAFRLSDPLTDLKNMGLVANGSAGQLIDVRVEHNFSSTADPQGTLARLCVKDYFIDSQTYRIVKIVDQIHPVETFTKSYPHEIDFGNYTLVDGVTAPMLITEKIDGQTTWQLQLQNISFNTGLTDTDFTLQ